MLSVVGFGSGRRRRPLIPPQSAARVASPTSDLARSLGQPDDVVEAARLRGREAGGGGQAEESRSQRTEQDCLALSSAEGPTIHIAREHFTSPRSITIKTDCWVLICGPY